MKSHTLFRADRPKTIPCPAAVPSPPGKLGHPLLFSFSVVRPTQIFAFFQEKQIIPSWEKSNFFSPLTWKINDVLANTDLLTAFLYAKCQFQPQPPHRACLPQPPLPQHVDFVTISCCFQAPWQWRRGTGPPSSSLLLIFLTLFFKSYRPTLNQETHSTLNEKKKQGKGLIGCESTVKRRKKCRAWSLT